MLVESTGPLLAENEARACSGFSIRRRQKLVALSLMVPVLFVELDVLGNHWSRWFS